MLARALAQDTPVLMLDEPTAHLDLPSRIRLMRLLHQLAHQTNKGILLSTHDLELALQVADEVWLLQNTETLHRGAPEDLVLNGAFEEAFAHEDIHFDKQTGTFSIQQTTGSRSCLPEKGCLPGGRFAHCAGMDFLLSGQQRSEQSHPPYPPCGKRRTTPLATGIRSK